MDLGMVGLGRMGSTMVKTLLSGGHFVALQARFRSWQDQPLAARLPAALRNRFGDYAVRIAE